MFCKRLLLLASVGLACSVAESDGETDGTDTGTTALPTTMVPTSTASTTSSGTTSETASSTSAAMGSESGEPSSTTSAPPPASPFDAPGMGSLLSVDGDARARFEAVIGGNENLGLVATVDHQVNAEGDGLELPPLAVYLFGNPAVGTPLMQANRQVAIDLPQKMLFHEAEGMTWIGYNTPEYLAQRHNLGTLRQLDMLSMALTGLAQAAAGSEEAPTNNDALLTKGEGLIVEQSMVDFATTTDQLDAALADAGLAVLVELDHAANAMSVDMTLPPTTLYVFGNPMAGTPLMQAGASTGIDLPQKILVYEEAGSVFVVYNDPGYVAMRHGLAGVDEVVSNISLALEGLVQDATTAG